MMLALVIVQLLLYATVRAWRRSDGLSSPFLIVLVLVTMIQIAFGTQVRSAIDVAIENGVARASALATAGRRDHLHRELALAVLRGCPLPAMRTPLAFPK